MKNVKKYIYEQVASHKLTEQEAKTMLLELQKGEKASSSQDIAIIGIAGKFSNADNLEEYWQNIITGENEVRPLPEERRDDVETYLKRFYYDKLVKNNCFKPDGHLDIKYEKQGYLNDISKFDSGFFRIPPREAKAMCVEQKIFLETAYEALEDAGYGGKSLSGTKTAVFVGMDHSSGLPYKEIADKDAMHTTGNWPGILASRISYIFDFKGPAVVIDTACSSGLVCVHEAIKSLNSGECTTAIAGGVSNIVYDGSVFEDTVKDLDSVESKKGVIRAFDNGVDGTAWGEGVGALVLKKLDKAIEDGDAIYAIIKGSAINNDGASNGITAPDVGAQEDVLLSAWEAAHVDPETIQYIEAHGTGTKLGDSIELKALTNAFNKKTKRKQFCGLGSVKSQIGHLVAASGVASLIKVILMMKNDLMPASVHFARPNHFIDFTNAPVYVNDRNTEWKKGDLPRRAGVSSFGFSGTNCHVIVEEYTGQKAEDQEKPFEIFTLAAKNKTVLQKMVTQYIHFIAENPDVNLHDLCYTLAVGRGHYECRLAAIVKTKEELLEQLKNYNEGKASTVYADEYKVVSKHRENADVTEITEGERRQFTKEAEEWTSRLSQECEEEGVKALVALYMKGADVKWEALYQSDKAKRCHIPTYPLERERCWYEESPEEIQERLNERAKSSVLQNTIGHSLVHTSVVDSIDQHIFATTFSAQKQWELGEHKIFANHILPGTSYLEMCIEACKNYYKSGMTLKNITFFIPMIVAPDEERECHTIVNKCEDHLKVTFASRKKSEDLDEEWVKHCECEVYENEEKGTETIDVAKLTETIAQKGSSIRCTKPGESKIQLGRRWSNESIVAEGGREFLVKLSLPEDIKEEVDHYNLHVSLLDNAVNDVSQRIYEGLYLPFFYKSFTYYSKMPREFYSYIKVGGNENSDHETITFDVKMIDLEGNVFAETNDYIIKHVTKTAEEFSRQGQVEDKFYALKWINKEVSLDQNIAEGTVVVFKGESPLSEQICTALKANHKVIEVEKETNYDQLFKDLKDENVKTILHLSTLDELGTGEVKTPEALNEIKQKGMDSVFYITRALVGAHYKEDIQLALVTDGAFKVEGNETIKPHNRAYLAIGKVIKDEHPNIKCCGIDVDQTIDAQTLIHLIAEDKACYQVAYRNGKVYEEELDEVAVNGEANLMIQKGGVYVVTGGLGGLGLAVAKHIAEKEKVKLVLIGRSELPGKREWFNILNGEEGKQKEAIKTILDIEDTGSQVTYMRANVSDKEMMTAVWEEIKSDYGKVNGVFHCAGVAGDGLIITKDKERFDSVIKPKVDGSWVLGQLMMQDKVDFVVFYSSMTSLFAGVGQSDYCIANNYMDGFAEVLNEQGIRALAVNWPAWQEVGMAVAYGVDDQHTFMLSMKTEEAFSNLAKLMGTNYTQVLPGKVNYAYLKAEIDRIQFKVGASIKKEFSKVKYSKAAKEEEKAQAQVEVNMDKNFDSIEDFLFNAWCTVLGTDKIDIYDSFSRLGGDSLMAIQLLKIIEKVYPDMVSVPDIFTYSSVADMTEFIKGKLEEQGASEEVAATEEKVENLSGDALENALEGIESGDASIEDVLKMLE